MALLLNAGDTVSRSYSYTQPSPLHPSQPQGTGERTGNLFDGQTEAGIYLAANGNKYGDYTNGMRAANKISVSAGTTYTLSCHSENIISLRILEWNGSTFVTQTPKYNISGDVYLTVTTDANTTQIAFNIEGVNGQYASKIMLNTGSTALPYEPWGIKIPISSASTTTPVYLGEVQTTRKIKKYEFTGNEDTRLYSGAGLLGFELNIADMLTNSRTLGASTHFKPQITGSGITTDGITFGANNKMIYITLSQTTISTYNLSDISTIRSWLSAQYAAGTPVTVWYVLAEPETAVVNEPLRKIGDYADEVSGISIPVTAGGDTLSVDVTVRPSEVTVNYKGWHPDIVHERNNGAWT